MKNTFLTFVILFFCTLSFAQKKSGQNWAWSNKLPNKIEIPFEYVNNLPVVKVVFHRIFQLKFIFDTGAEHSILSRKEFTDILGMRYMREFDLIGADMSQNLKAHLVQGVHLQVGNRMVLPYHSLLVLEDDYFRFEEMTGQKIHGILGSDIFRNFVVKINFQRQIITLFKPETFKLSDDEFEEIPIEVFKHRPFIKLPVRVYGDSVKTAKLLLDTGATIAVILHTNTSLELNLPPNLISGRIGMGLGGFLEGYLGRVEEMDIGSRKMNHVLANFQELPEHVDTTLLNGRNGIIGNQILHRFHLIFDYWNQKLYVKPNREFDKEFKYDKSGIVVVAAGVQLNRLLVHDVLENSPAYEAGIKRGDDIRSINRIPINFYSLQDVNAIFSKKEGKKIRLAVKRNGQKVILTFRLRKLI